jgi:predicted PurR-regulated permease PerM
MTEQYKSWIGFLLTLLIIASSLYIVHRFIPSLVWSSIIAVVTYPLYERFRQYFYQYNQLAAFLFTFLLAVLFLIPLSWLITVLVTELQVLINYLQMVNRDGGAAPDFIHHIPFIGRELTVYWDANIGHPGNVLSTLHLALTPASYYIKQVGFNLVHRSVQFGFTLMSLFFFYRDGDILARDIHRVGELCLGSARWSRYANRLPYALRATVNGTIFVGLAVGLLMGGCYALVGFPAPTLTGFVTAFAAMIPFAVPLVFVIVALVLMASGSLIGAIIVLSWGTLVMFIADHFVKPVLIGGAIQLPFLAVLFGILGGVETLGLLGLFVGPMIMVLLVTLWQESLYYHKEQSCL